MPGHIVMLTTNKAAFHRSSHHASTTTFTTNFRFISSVARTARTIRRRNAALHECRLESCFSSQSLQPLATLAINYCRTAGRTPSTTGRFFHASTLFGRNDVIFTSSSTTTTRTTSTSTLRVFPPPPAVQAHCNQIQRYHNSFPEEYHPTKDDWAPVDELLRTEPVQSALLQLHRITGIHEHHHVRPFLFYLLATDVDVVQHWIRERLVPWSKLGGGRGGGRDLFLRGWGGFDLNQVLHATTETSRLSRPALLESTCWSTFRFCNERHWRFIYSGIVRTNPERIMKGPTHKEHYPFWLPTPSDVQIEAYFPNVRKTKDSYIVDKLKHLLLLSETEEEEEQQQQQNQEVEDEINAYRRSYLMRYREYWNQNPNSLEIFLGSSTHKFANQTMSLLQEGDFRKQRLLPPQKLLELLDDSLQYLDNLKDSYTVSREGECKHGLQLRVLRTKRQLVQVGKSLHNCLSQDPEEYFANVRHQKSLVVALYKTCSDPNKLEESSHFLNNGGGTPLQQLGVEQQQQQQTAQDEAVVVVVGEYSLETQTWNEIREDRNADPSTATVAAYDEYAKNFIAPWWFQRSMSREDE